MTAEGGDECFSVDGETGVVRTRCPSSSLKPDNEYEIGVSAVDLAGETAPLPQKSPTQSVKILVGQRQPQFFELQYIASVPEGSPEQFKYAAPSCHFFLLSDIFRSRRFFDTQKFCAKLLFLF